LECARDDDGTEAETCLGSRRALRDLRRSCLHSSVRKRRAMYATFHGTSAYSTGQISRLRNGHGAVPAKNKAIGGRKDGKETVQSPSRAPVKKCVTITWTAPSAGSLTVWQELLLYSYALEKKALASAYIYVRFFRSPFLFLFSALASSFLSHLTYQMRKSDIC